LNTGETVKQGIALTANPNTDVMYAMLNTQAGETGRKFVSINTNGAATFISDLTVSKAMTGMAFHPTDPTC